MNVLIAFDKFKDSMNAKTACVVAANTLHKIHPTWQVSGAPLTDGGEGFCEIMTEALGGGFQPLKVLGPRFVEKQALLGFIPMDRIPDGARQLLDLPDRGNLAIVEMAQASGLESLPADQRDCLKATSYGTGELLAFAIEQGADAILLGIGGSATSDLGLGALEAMGLEFRDDKDRPLTRITPEGWKALHHFKGNLLHPGVGKLPPIRIACDVRNPLFGDDGAAAVYGPQKGLREKDLPYFEEEGKRLAQALITHFESDSRHRDVPGAGAAGGIGFGLMVAAGAKLVPGFELVSRWLLLEEKIEEADRILTGEGKFDDSSLQGKGPFTVLEMAQASGKTKSIHLFAGVITVNHLDSLKSRFKNFSATPIAHPEWSLKENLAKGPERLEAALIREFQKGNTI